MKLKDLMDNMHGMDFTNFTIKTIESWLEEDVSVPVIKSDMYEKGRELIIEMDVPGIEVDSIECFIQSNVIYVQGIKAETVAPDVARYNQIERSFGNFTKTIPIPITCDTKDVKAVLKSGVLKIILKKIEERRHSKTHIKIERG
ncbi:MAG: Hsp20/alpha crystallin family protein [Deltaproteobacteria bacterium]|nr:Hsp20/alpha crystallin family protein [Deltaproteobacteria bacterium]MCL5276304.1 Hsp20/alpha crystallin family protein [Deltaproteobacteria bacterium]